MTGLVSRYCPGFQEPLIVPRQCGRPHILPVFRLLPIMFTSTLIGKWAAKFLNFLVSVLSSTVFLFLDFLDPIFCLLYGILDTLIEGQPTPCYCEKVEEVWRNAGGDAESQLSDTLCRRRNVFRDMGLLRVARKWKKNCCHGDNGGEKRKWSDCPCKYCVSWMESGDQKLHFIVEEPLEATTGLTNEQQVENVIFIHGFLASSSYWTEPLFSNLSTTVKRNYRLFAVDLLGFGKSPRPTQCFYTLKDHREGIENSVIRPYQLNSFHLVAHSMGCIVALALAAKYSKSVKSIVLVAPPYFSSEPDASIKALEKLAKKRLWPPLLFGAAFMSWYEHLGRCVCLIICRLHWVWEWIARKFNLNRDLSFLFVDMTKHTHHSAWHSMHNVICGGANFTDSYLETLTQSGVKINVIQGDRDQIVPLDCSRTIKKKFPEVEVKIIPKTDHFTVILGRTKEFTRELENLWLLSTHLTSRTR